MHALCQMGPELRYTAVPYSSSVADSFACCFVQAAGHKTLVPQLIAELKKLKADNIGVVCGGVIPPAVRIHALCVARSW